MGFKPMASVLLLQCSDQFYWAIKTHTLRAGQFVEFIFTDERNEIKHKDDVNCRNTNLNEDMIIAVVITISEIADDWLNWTPFSLIK